MAKVAKNSNRGSKPGERRGGRQKGTLNKTTREAKQAIAEAAERLGGVDRLVAWAQEDAGNEKVFWGTIYPKLLPLQVNGTHDVEVVDRTGIREQARDEVRALFGDWAAGHGPRADGGGLPH